jgi:hypothetical protein
MNTNQPLKALAEIRKNLAEIQITAIDCQAHIMALKATVLEIGGLRVQELFEKHLAEERNRLLTMHDEQQKIVEQLKKVIETLEPPQGPVN